VSAMSQTSVRLVDFPRVEASTSDVNAQSPQGPQADQTTADAVYQARHRRRSVAQNPLLHYPLGKINRSTLPSQAIRFSGQKLRGPIPDCCRISRELSRATKSSEQFVWLNRRYGETETQLSRSAIMPSTRAASSQNEVIEAAATSVGCHPWSASVLGSQTASSEGISDGVVCPG